MYPVTTEFQNKIKETTRTFKLSVQIQHSSGILELTDKDIVGGSVVFTESSQTGDDFSIGGTVASTFEFELFRKPEHDLITFEGATVIPQVGLLISSSVDIENYFINAPQPSEFEDSQILEQWEFVPLGRFNVDEINKSRNSIKLKAIDNMIELDKPYSLSNLSYPANLYQIYQNICSVADIQPATTSFTNQNHIVQTRPDGDYSLRDILGFVAELSGSFARCNRNGALELAWYEDVGLTLTGANRFDFKPREDLIQIKGVKFETEDTVYIAGTDDYVVDLTDNPLLQDSYSTVLANIYNKVKQVVFTPFESRWQGNPAIQTGDIITQVDRDNVSHATLVTHSTYKYRGASTLAARGLPLKAKGYKGSTNKKISNIVRKEIKPIGDKLTALEQAQLNVTELIANMLGGYAFYEADGFYIADNPVLTNAQKVWKWGIGGFGYSENGVEGPYTTAISADGTIVAMLVAANIITADMVKTGILSSEDDSTWINLNDGTFNFKNLLKYTDGVLEMPAPELPGDIVRSDVSYNGTVIGTTEGIRVEFAEGGSAVIGEGGIRVQHNDGSKTSIDGRGITRIFSIPIFEQQPSGTNIIDTFESGINNSRVNIASSEAFGFGYDNNITELIHITSDDKYAGSYSLKVKIPPQKVPMSVLGGSGYRSNITCRFLNYRPTKDTTFSMWYKAILPSGVSAKLYIDDLDYPEIPTQILNLTATTWSSVSAYLTKHHTYGVRVYLSYSGDSSSSINGYVYLDNMQYELNVNEDIIVGYEESIQPYYDFTYIRKGHFDANGTQQIVLPDYFKGMNFDVFIMPTGNWEWYSTSLDAGEPRIQVDSINNMVPSFTCTYFRYPQKEVDFIYTVVLNN
jgi:hypothetical protein